MSHAAVRVINLLDNSSVAVAYRRFRLSFHPSLSTHISFSNSALRKATRLSGEQLGTRAQLSKFE